MSLCRARPIDRKALELYVYGVTARGKKVGQGHFFLSEPADLNTVFQLVRIRHIDVVRIVIDIALPVVDVEPPRNTAPVDETNPLDPRGRWP